MSSTSMQSSFYYVLIAKTCFQRSRIASDSAHSSALCEMGRAYLLKAELATETHERRQGA